MKRTDENGDEIPQQATFMVDEHRKEIAAVRAYKVRQAELERKRQLGKDDESEDAD